MKLWPFFTYYGGKYRIAPRYPKPLYDSIIEPFAGSAGYSLRYPQKAVFLYDVNPRIVSVWQYLLKVSESEILNLPELFEDLREVKNISQEAKWLIGFWCNKGSCEPRNRPSIWMKSGIRPNSQWGQAIKQRIASQLASIRHWKVLNRGYDDIENITATWFIDPPYSCDAGRLYTYDQIDYVRLKDYCLNRNGQTIVCESDGANWLPFEPFVTAKGLEGPKGKKKIKEVIWTNIRSGKQ